MSTSVQRSNLLQLHDYEYLQFLGTRILQQRMQKVLALLTRLLLQERDQRKKQLT